MRARHDNRGMLSPVMIVVIVVVLAAIGFVGWKVSSNKNSNKTASSSTSTPTAAANSAVETACNKEINDKIFCKFASHFSLSNAYKATITSTDSSGATTKVELSSDTKSNTSMVTKDAGGAETGAFITLDSSSYIKDESSGSWTKYTSSASTSATTTKPTSDIKIDTSDITNNKTNSFKNLGTEACGSLTCYKYQVVDTANPGTTQYIWFDNKNYQMQRWSNKDANGTSDMSFSYQNVNITVPSPVHDFTTQ